MEDKLANLRGSIKEVYSSIMVLRDAVTNENGSIEYDQIEDLLDILIFKMGNNILLFDEFTDEFVKKYLKEQA